MKEIKTTKTIEEVTGYEAFDGTYFRSADECKRYEESAEGVVKASIYNQCIGQTCEYVLFDCGSEECEVNIYNIKDKDTLDKLNQYRRLKDKTCSLITDDYIGKEVMVFWDWDGHYSWFKTIDEILKDIKHSYELCKKKPEDKEEQKGE